MLVPCLPEIFHQVVGADEVGLRAILDGPEAADSNACGVEISPADANPATAGHQVDLADDGAVVAVTVTAADCATTGTYTLTVSLGGIRPAAARRLTRPLSAWPRNRSRSPPLALSGFQRR